MLRLHRLGNADHGDDGSGKNRRRISFDPPPRPPRLSWLPTAWLAEQECPLPDDSKVEGEVDARRWPDGEALSR